MRIKVWVASLALPVFGLAGCSNGSDSKVVEEVQTSETAAVRVTGAGGAETLTLDSNGRLSAEVRVANVEALRTIGFAAQVEGGVIERWNRVDPWIQNGGQILQLTGSAKGSRLELVFATTQPATATDEKGHVVATLKIRPTADVTRVNLETEGAFGLVAQSGPLAVTALGASTQGGVK